MAKILKTLGVVEYRVAWSQARSRFDIFRGADRTPSFSPQQSIAIGLAIRDAKLEAAETGQKVIVTSMRNDKRVMEWDAWSIRTAPENS